MTGSVVEVEASADERWRREFPILRDWTYLDHATFGPTPRAHVRASQEAVARTSELPIAEIGSSGAMEALRREAAALLHSGDDSLALLKCTSEGIDLVAQGLSWQAGDEVILYDADFPGTLAPWIALERKGVILRMIADRGRSRFDVEDVEALISSRTRAICISLVNSSHGFRAPAGEIAALTRPRGIWFALDAVQAIGTGDIDVPALGADVVAAHGYKFLLSGFGVALVWCSPRAIAELDAPQIGWKNTGGPRPMGVSFAEGGARRFESTIASYPAVEGMRGSLSLLASVGLAATGNRIAALVDALADAVPERGYSVRSSRKPGETSAILSLRHSSLDAEAVQQALKQARVACAVRDGSVRIAPHFHNSLEDVGRLVAALPV
ncbi:MAG TPA: aminotransferase class V-fold PLP-dependent enzyme [Acidimicrobiales bacterium]|nr:aminotransferase class V-fold PLP-dependent enzyme [Acidimicrobiales bacterium]